jgi:hypothetical protein
MKSGKLFNRSFIFRARKNKTRYGVSSGECFHNIQFYKYALYIEKKNPLRLVNFKSIKDFYETQRTTTHITKVS